MIIDQWLSPCLYANTLLFTVATIWIPNANKLYLFIFSIRDLIVRADLNIFYVKFAIVQWRIGLSWHRYVQTVWKVTNKILHRI